MDTKEFAAATTSVYEHISKRGGRIVSHQTVAFELYSNSGNPIDHSVIVAEFPDEPADRSIDSTAHLFDSRKF
jgi:hypothetical protein